MDILAILVAVAVVLVSGAYIVKTYLRKAELRRKINKLPGPRTFPIIGTTYIFYNKLLREMLPTLIETTEKYAPIYRTWNGSKPLVYLTKPEHFEAIIHGTKHLAKGDNYDFFRPWLGTGLITSAGQKWHAHRKMITPTFHLGILTSFVEVFAEKCEILVDKLEQKANRESFDICPYIVRCTLDIICETAMGVPIYAQDDADSEYIKAITNLIEITMYRYNRVWLHPNFIFYNTPIGRTYNKCLTLIKGFTKKVIQERKAALSNTTKVNQELSDEDSAFGIKKRKAFLDMLLEASEKHGQLTDEELGEEVGTFMFAGHDTTSTSTNWVLFMLGHHPEIQEKVYAELSEIFQGSQRAPTIKDLHDMKYMDMVIKETLRVYPSVPFIERVLSEDVCIEGYDIPAGTSVCIMIYFANRNPEYFQNPEQFDPENFLPESVHKRHNYAFIPFSAGPRNCIGQKFALLEEKTLLTYILRKFKVQSVDKREDVKPVPDIVLKPENGIKVTLTLRQ